MTLDDLKEKPLKRGACLIHGILGLVLYKSKVRNHPEEIIVQRTDNKERVRVPLAHVTRDTKPQGKIQGSRLILAHCHACGLKIRASGKTYEMGTPLCFNAECENLNQPLEIEWGEKGDGVLGFDKGEMMKQHNANQATRENRRPNDPDSPDEDEEDFLTKAGKL